MANLINVTGTVCQAPVLPTVLTRMLPTAAVDVGAPVKWEAFSYMFGI